MSAMTDKKAARVRVGRARNYTVAGHPVEAEKLARWPLSGRHPDR